MSSHLCGGTKSARAEKRAELIETVTASVEAERVAMWRGKLEKSRAAVTRELKGIQTYRRSCYGFGEGMTALTPSYGAEGKVGNAEAGEVEAGEDLYVGGEDDEEKIVPEFSSRALHGLLGLGKCRDLVEVGSVSESVLMARAPLVPMYNTWVPVKREFWFGKDLFPKPHMPFLGDDDADRTHAFDVWKKMNRVCGDEGEVRGREDNLHDVSDGEIDSDGHFIAPNDEDDEGWGFYFSLAEQRRRQVTRAIIMKADDEYGLCQNNTVVGALCKALGLRNRQHVLKHLEQARFVADEALKVAAKVAANKKLLERFDEASTVLGDAVEVAAEAWSTEDSALPLRYFCFTCHVFYCRQHEGQNIEPVMPIRDIFVESRVANIERRLDAAKYDRLDGSEGSSDSGEDSDSRSTGSSEMFLTSDDDDEDVPFFCEQITNREPLVTVCGDECHLSEDRLRALASPQSPPHPGTPVSEFGVSVNVWTLKERMLVREALPVFQNDPCSISKVVGQSKSCLETAAFLSSEEMAGEVQLIVTNSARRRWPQEQAGNRDSVNEMAERDDSANDSSSSDSAVESFAGRPRSRQRQVRSCGGKSASGDFQKKDFVPCAHLGPCDRAVCSCFKNKLPCESTCGCSNGRWTQTHGYLAVDSSGKRNLRSICALRHKGCDCGPGKNCNTEKCSCWKAMRSCDPDLCQHCEASILPDRTHPKERKCRNVGVLTAWHKRTIIGSSRVHGYGLFCGEQFEAGDLVGVYG